MTRPTAFLRSLTRRSARGRLEIFDLALVSGDVERGVREADGTAMVHVAGHGFSMSWRGERTPTAHGTVSDAHDGGFDVLAVDSLMAHAFERQCHLRARRHMFTKRQPEVAPGLDAAARHGPAQGHIVELLDRAEERGAGE
jgi:hypothetical protein